jgi:hypothetical protein
MTVCCLDCGSRLPYDWEEIKLVRPERNAARRRLLGYLKWGGLAALLIGAYWLYCIGVGFDPLRWMKGLL